jgi:hypothetical protein
MNFGNINNNNNELAHYAFSPVDELMREHQKELNMLHARYASPVTLQHVKKMQMEEMKRLTSKSPLPLPRSPEEHPALKPLGNLTRDELLNRHRQELNEARSGSPAFVEWTKAQQAEQLREWNASHRPNNSNNNEAANEEAFGELSPLHNNGLRELNTKPNMDNNNATNEAGFGGLGPLRKPTATRPRRRTMKQRKTRRGKSRRYSRR